jgi:hypothetical protein
MTEENKNIQQEEEILEDSSEIDEEEFEERDWKKILIGVLFVLAVVVLWYVIEYAAR